MLSYIITYKNGSRLGALCTDFRTKDNLLIIEGYDDVNYADGPERKYWMSRTEWSEIKEFKVEVLMDDEIDNI